MKITDVKLYILENPDSRGSVGKLREVPNLRRIQYTHGGAPSPDKTQRQNFIAITTDAGISSRSISDPDGSATSITACGTSPAKQLGSPCTHSSAKCGNGFQCTRRAAICRRKGT